MPQRFGKSLEDFLREPTGTMAMVLSSRIVLTDGDRAIAIAKLEEAYALYRLRSAGAGRPVASRWAAVRPYDSRHVARDRFPLP